MRPATPSSLTVLFTRLPATPPPSDCEVVPFLDVIGQQRFAQYLNAPDKWRFLLGRALLFFGLETLFDIQDRELGFDHFGRPFLSASPKIDIDFNISHAGAWVVCAFARTTQVGVDVVDVNEFGDWRELLSVVLSPSERSHILALETACQQETVALYWSIKEAVLKSIGVGLQVDPSNITIDFHLSDQSKIKKYYVFVGDYPVGFSVISLNIRKNVILSLAFESIFSHRFDVGSSNADQSDIPRFQMIPVDILRNFRGSAGF